MDSKLDCIKFCCKNEIKCSDTLKMLQKCYGDDTLSKTQVYQWYERFKSGREAVEDDARPGRPSTSKTDENLRGTRFESVEAIKLKSLEALMAIPKTDFQKSFEGWIKRWHKCIAADGDYFEGDNLNFEE
ncbi:GVQW3 protein, partial [Acromyrmex charruanus]